MKVDETICEACLPDAEKVESADLVNFFKTTEGWELSDDVDFPQVRKSFKVGDFKKAQEFTNLVGELAEEEGHHPSIILEYGKVTVKWWSHKIQGIHKKDLELSKKTDALFVEMKK